MEIVKQFLEWIKLKEKLHGNKYKPPLFKEGEIWWCSLGENIGSEINGKSDKFTRPVIVFRKLSSTTFLGVPTTTQARKGTWYVKITLHNKDTVAILSQIRILSYKRLYSKLGELDKKDFNYVKNGFRKL